MDPSNPLSDETYECLEHGRRFENRADYLAHRTADHLDVPADAAADRDEIPRAGDAEPGSGPLAGAESAKAEQSDESEGLEERMVSYGQTEDHPARLEHDDRLERDVHRAPTPSDTNR